MSDSFFLNTSNKNKNSSKNYLELAPNNLEVASLPNFPVCGPMMRMTFGESRLKFAHAIFCNVCIFEISKCSNSLKSHWQDIIRNIMKS